MKISLGIIAIVASLLILYLVIVTAVKDGINKSIVGQYFDRKNGEQREKRSFLDRDLDLG